MARLMLARTWLSRSVAVLGLVGSASLGERSLAIAITCLLVAVAGWSRRRPLGPALRKAWRWANSGVSLLCLGAVAYDPMMLDAVAALLCWLLAYRAWVHREPRSDRVNLLLSLMVLLLGSVTTSAPMILSLSVLWGLCAAPLLALSHLTEDGEGSGEATDSVSGWRVAGLVPMTALLGLGMLVAMPVESKDTGSAFSGEGSERGSAGSLVLSELGQITENRGVVLRARLEFADGESYSEPQYFPLERLGAYDARRGRWSGQELPVTVGPESPPVDTSGLVFQELTLEALGGGQLLALSEAVAMDVPGGVMVDSQGRWWQAEGPGRVNYRAWSQPEVSGESSKEGESIPQDLDPRVLDQAMEWLSELPNGASERSKALHLESRLRESLSYTRVPNRAEQEQSLSAFLFSTRQGHCTYFATALAMMLRAAGIESRFVRGFYGGEISPIDDVLRIRRSDAHAWVEAYIDGSWLRLDATPSMVIAGKSSLLEAVGEWLATHWLVFLLHLETTELGQMALAMASWLESQAMLVIVGLLLLLSALLAFRLGGDWWGRARAESGRGRVAVQYDRARALVLRRGWRIPVHLPPRQAGLWLISRAGPLAEPLESLATLHYRVRYGGEPDGLLWQQAEACLSELGGLPRRRRTH